MRYSSHKTNYDKGYMPNWTKQHFTVSQAVPPKRGCKSRVYKLVDYNDEAVKGSWYPKEISKFQNTSFALKKTCVSVLYLTAQNNQLSGGKVGQTSTTRGSQTQSYTMSSLRDEFQVLLACQQAMLKAIQETNLTNMKRNLHSHYIFVANGMLL